MNNKERLFEMMNRVGGMPLIENNGMVGLNLPTGILPNDFMSLEDYNKEVPCSTNMNEEDPNDFGAKMQPVKDVEKLLNKKDNEINNKHQDYDTGGRIHRGTMDDIRTNGGFDVEKLKKILSHVPTPEQFIKQNGKMGKSNFYNVTLPAFKGLIYNQSDDKFYVISVCSKAGECTRDCYAQMGRYIMFDDTVRLNTQKLNYLMNHWEEWKERMINSIKAMSFAGGSVVRWHDSGDFLSEKYLQIAYEIAEATPNDYHYAYTKEINMVLKNKAPDNFEFKFSYGGKEDSSIDPTTHGHARIIPDEIFKDLQNKKGSSDYWKFSPEKMNIIKDRIAKKYSIDRNKLITNAELMQIPYDKNNPRKWIVINKSGDNDIPALRRDVLAVYNLKHR